MEALEPHKMTSLGIIEDFFQQEASEEICSGIERLPSEQLWVLLERLDTMYDLWLGKRLGKIDLAASSDRSTPIRTFQPIFTGMDYFYRPELFERWLRCSLLYYPGPVAMPDPVGGADLRLARTGRPGFDESTAYAARETLIRGLRATMDLRPLISRGDVVLVPEISVERAFDSVRTYFDILEAMHLSQDDSEMFTSLDVELARIHPAIIRRIYEMDELTNRIMPAPWEDEAFGQDLEWAYDLPIARWLWAGAEMEFSPVAADERVQEKLDVGIQSLARVTSQTDIEAAVMFARFQIPGPDSASLKQVVALRQNEEVFHEFRSTFEYVLRQTSQAAPADQGIFDLEFRRHAEATLNAERRRILSNRERSPVLAKMLTGSFLFGAAGIESAITKQPPVGSALAASAGGLAWLLPYLATSRTRARSSEQRRLFLSYLVGQR